MPRKTLVQSLLITVLSTALASTVFADTRNNEAKLWNSLNESNKQMYVGAFISGMDFSSMALSNEIKDKSRRKKFVDQNNRRLKVDIAQASRLVNLYYSDPAVEYAFISMTVSTAITELTGLWTREESLEFLRDVSSAR